MISEYLGIFIRRFSRQRRWNTIETSSEEVEGIFRQNSSNYVEDDIYWRKISQVITKKKCIFSPESLNHAIIGFLLLRQLF